MANSKFFMSCSSSFCPFCEERFFQHGYVHNALWKYEYCPLCILKKQEKENENEEKDTNRYPITLEVKERKVSKEKKREEKDFKKVLAQIKRSYERRARRSYERRTKRSYERRAKERLTKTVCTRTISNDSWFLFAVMFLLCFLAFILRSKFNSEGCSNI
jgi:hypothetical protein